LNGTKTFTFNVYAQNTYNQTGLLTVTINVEPNCGDAAGCGPKIMLYTGMSLYDAENNYPLTGIWYSNRFVKVKSNERPVLT
jgi:hypothetical protein